MSSRQNINRNPKTSEDHNRNWRQLGSAIVDEEPAGDIDGSNGTFTLANTPLEGTLKLYSDGLRVPTGAYTTAVTAGVFTITMTASKPTVSLAADYRV